VKPTEKQFMLATADGDLGLVPASKAQAEAAKLAAEEGKNVTVRDPVTDRVINPHRSKRAARKRRLTELSVRKARADGDAPAIIWDTQQRGLALRVQPTGGKSWYCVYSRQGRPRWLRLGHADAIGLADARKLAAKAMLAVAEGKDPAAEKKAERGAGTFAELHDKYLEQHAKKANKSWRQADAIIRGKVLPRWGKLQASTIMRGDVKALMASIAAPIAANQTLAAVSAVFTWGVREEIVLANPCKLVARNATTSRERILSESELAVFWKALDDVEPTAAAALKTVLLTGQRPGEVAHMRHEHLKDGWWELPGAPVPSLGWPGTKNAASHRVWLPQAVQDIIADMRDGDDSKIAFVFAGPRGRPVRGMDAGMRAISTKLGGEPARPHDLRRTHGSTITALGFGREAMNRIQNHAEGGIASVYDRHGYAEENKRIMEAVAGRLLSLAEGRAGENKIVKIY
jgi:integrase